MRERADMTARAGKHGCTSGPIWLCRSGLVWGKESRAILDRVSKIQYNFSGTNTDGSLTTAVSNSFLSPLEKNLIAADLG